MNTDDELREEYSRKIQQRRQSVRFSNSDILNAVNGDLLCSLDPEDLEDLRKENNCCWSFGQFFCCCLFSNNNNSIKKSLLVIFLARLFPCLKLVDNDTSGLSDASSSPPSSRFFTPSNMTKRFLTATTTGADSITSVNFTSAKVNTATTNNNSFFKCSSCLKFRRKSHYTVRRGPTKIVHLLNSKNQGIREEAVVDGEDVGNLDSSRELKMITNLVVEDSPKVFLKEIIALKAANYNNKKIYNQEPSDNFDVNVFIDDESLVLEELNNLNEQKINVPSYNLLHTNTKFMSASSSNYSNLFNNKNNNNINQQNLNYLNINSGGNDKIMLKKCSTSDLNSIVSRYCTDYSDLSFTNDHENEPPLKNKNVEVFDQKVNKEENIEVKENKIENDHFNIVI